MAVSSSIIDKKKMGMIWTWVSEEGKSSWSGFFSHNDTDMGRRWMEDKLKLEFVVNQIQDNGNTSASLVSVEHKPDRKITVSWTTKSKSIFLYVDVEFPTHFTPFGFRCLPKSTQCNWFVKSYQIQLDMTRKKHFVHEMIEHMNWDITVCGAASQLIWTKMSNCSDLSINQLTWSCTPFMSVVATKDWH